MKFSDIRSRYLLLARLFILLSVLGVGILIFTSFGEDPTGVAFSLIAFVISVAALLMTTLQGLSIARQVRLTEKAAREVKETGEQLKRLVVDDKRLAKEVHEDIELDHEIISALKEHGIGDSDEQRHAMASTIAHKLRHHRQR